MKFMDKFTVPGTQIIIGKKCQYRKNSDGNSVERVAKSYTAEYRDHEGKRRFEGLGTTNKREAIQRASLIHQQIADGVQKKKPSARLKLSSLIERFLAFSESKNLAKTTLARYHSEMDKLRTFCTQEGIEYPSGFTEEQFYRYGQWLREQIHKQHSGYSPSSLETSAILCKMMFKWGRTQGFIREDPIARGRIPKVPSVVQPCFTTEQVYGDLPPNN